MAYTPRYTSRDEIPVQVPDDYTEREKNAALEVAEANLELDLNDAEPIPDDEFTVMMEAAVKQKATCELVKGADDPNSVKMGDLTDDGTNKQDFAESFCDRYDELVQKIQDSGAAGEDSSTEPYVYNTSPPR